MFPESSTMTAEELQISIAAFVGKDGELRSIPLSQIRNAEDSGQISSNSEANKAATRFCQLFRCRRRSSAAGASSSQDSRKRGVSQLRRSNRPEVLRLHLPARPQTRFSTRFREQ